jgi:cytochrome c oxidase assembly protein subunit 15
MIRRLALLACIFTLCITAASAFIRNTQAGLGCSPWPQCLAQQAEARGGSGMLRMAPSTTGPGEVDAVFVARALHRISAVLVGLLALGIVLFGWSRLVASDRAAAAFALVDTVFLSWLGRYTPHDVPLVTIGNVLGGFALAAAFGWIAAGGSVQGGPPRAGGRISPGPRWRWPACSPPSA